MSYTKFDTVYGEAFIAIDGDGEDVNQRLVAVSGAMPPNKRYPHAQRQITLGNGSQFQVLDNRTNLAVLAILTGEDLGKPTWEPPKPKEPKPKAKRGAKGAKSGDSTT